MVLVTMCRVPSIPGIDLIVAHEVTNVGSDRDQLSDMTGFGARSD